MITEKELHEAIAECQGQRNPNANTCIKLASFYTILDHMAEKPSYSEMPNYSFANETENTVKYQSGTEFADAVISERYRICRCGIRQRCERDNEYNGRVDEHAFGDQSAIISKRNEESGRIDHSLF